MRAGPGGARLIILIKEQQGARDCNMSYALSQIAKSSDRTQNNANSLVSGRLNPGNVSKREEKKLRGKGLERKDDSDSNGEDKTKDERPHFTIQ